MFSVLLTRSVRENYKLAQQLKLYNLKCISCPLIEYQNLQVDYASILNHYSNIIITSKYGATLLYDALKCTPINDFRQINLWIVGEISTNILQLIPCIRIKYTARDVHDLIHNLPKNLLSDFIYLSANKITKLLPSQIRRQIIYNVIYMKTLEPHIVTELMRGIDYLLLYSRNCARILIKLVIKYDLVDALRDIVVITISDKVADIVVTHVNNVVYANHAEQEQMINLLLSHVRKK